MELKPYDRIEDLSCQWENVILRHGLEQVLGTKEGKNQWRKIMISKIKPKPFSDKLVEVLDYSLNKAIREDVVHFFEWLQERVVANAREDRRDTGSPQRYNHTPSKRSPPRKPFKKGKQTGSPRDHTGSPQRYIPSSKKTAERMSRRANPAARRLRSGVSTVEARIISLLTAQVLRRMISPRAQRRSTRSKLSLLSFLLKP
jgi:hypothetical protein